eukprot:1700949-Rhodomonas_salina.1
MAALSPQMTVRPPRMPASPHSTSSSSCAASSSSRPPTFSCARAVRCPTLMQVTHSVVQVDAFVISSFVLPLTAQC